MTYEPTIADQIREHRAGADIVGVIALTHPNGMRGFSATHDRRSSEPAAGE
jgi:hypothetical protein